MFEIAPSEMLLFAIVALVVIGPKDLPKAMRFVGKWVSKAKGMARHFRSGMDAMMRESELEEMEKQWRAQNEAIMKAYPQLDAPFAADMAPVTAAATDAVDTSSSAALSVPVAPHVPGAAAPAADGEKG